MFSNSLTDFQHQLLSSLQQTNVAPASFVAITLDDDRWLVDLSAIREASVPPKIARSVGAPNWVLGIGNFKGNVWSVLDMRVLLQDEMTYNPKWGWVTLLHPRNGHEVALLWSEIVEIAPQKDYQAVNAQSGAEGFKANEQQTEEPHPWCKQQWLDKRGQMWKEFDVEKLLGEQGLIANWVHAQKSQQPVQHTIPNTQPGEERQ